MTTPTGTEYRMVLAGADGKIVDSFLPDTVMPQAELEARLTAISKPAGGWASTDLTAAVQTSLSKADTALQSAPVTTVANKTGAVTLVAADISNSTTVGRNVLTATDAAAARAAIGAGTSNLVLGTSAGQAAEGTHTHPYNTLTGIPATFPPSAHTHDISQVTNLQANLDNLSAQIGSHTHTAAAITDATTVGKAVLTAVDAAAARTAIGAGTSSLTIGSTASTAKAGNWNPSAANITDSTNVGRAVLTAADAAAARTAIGAGTSDLALGTTATTAKAGNYAPTWGEVTGKPSTFTPSTHTHLWADITNPPATYAPSAHTHVATDISNSTATGRSLLTAADAAAARTAIGAGTSSLAIGTTGTTAAAGNDARLSDQRVPTDGSVTNAKVSASAAIALNKLATGNVIGFDNLDAATISVYIVTEAEYAAFDAGAKGVATNIFFRLP